MPATRMPLKYLPILVLALAAGEVQASKVSSNGSRPGAAARATTPARAPAALAVSSSAAGQAGYVHYFRITHPDGTLEDQVGIALDAGRVAWSFPGAGVMVSEFIRNGGLNVNGEAYRIEHLYGVRPFASEAAMRKLQKELELRVAYWVDQETPYCAGREPGGAFCLNCGDFVTLVLFPGRGSPLVASPPADFLRAPRSPDSNDDLLLYMMGLHQLPDEKSKLRKLATLDMPDALRYDLAAMISTAGSATLTADRDPASRAPRGRVAARRPQAPKL